MTQAIAIGETSGSPSTRSPRDTRDPFPSRNICIPVMVVPPAFHLSPRPLNQTAGSGAGDDWTRAYVDGSQVRVK
jgi:hypothetical protein